ncbi:hypothetical protein Tcan_00899, partial [Toxocara canis]
FRSSQKFQPAFGHLFMQIFDCTDKTPINFSYKISSTCIYVISSPLYRLCDYAVKEDDIRLARMEVRKGRAATAPNLETATYKRTITSVKFAESGELRAARSNFYWSTIKKVVKCCLNPVLLLCIAMMTFMLLVIVGHSTGWIY